MAVLSVAASLKATAGRAPNASVRGVQVRGCAVFAIVPRCGRPAPSRSRSKRSVACDLAPYEPAPTVLSTCPQPPSGLRKRRGWPFFLLHSDLPRFPEGFGRADRGKFGDYLRSKPLSVCGGRMPQWHAHCASLFHKRVPGSSGLSWRLRASATPVHTLLSPWVRSCR